MDYILYILLRISTFFIAGVLAVFIKDEAYLLATLPIFAIIAIEHLTLKQAKSMS